MVAEGLTMYLTEDDGIALLTADRRPVPFGGAAIRRLQLAGHQDAVDQCGGPAVGLHALLGDQRSDDIITAVPGTTLLQWVPVFELDVFARIGRGYGLMAAVMNRIPGVRTMAQFHRYAY